MISGCGWVQQVEGGGIRSNSDCLHGGDMFCRYIGFENKGKGDFEVARPCAAAFNSLNNDDDESGREVEMMSRRGWDRH